MSRGFMQKNKKIFQAPGIGQRLKDFRTFLKMTQIELETATNISQSNIARFENESLLPTVDYLAYLHKVYKLNLHWLVTGNGTMVTHEDQIIPLNLDFITQQEMLDIIDGLKIPLFKYALLERLEELKVEHKTYLQERKNVITTNATRSNIG